MSLYFSQTVSVFHAFLCGHLRYQNISGARALLSLARATAAGGRPADVGTDRRHILESQGRRVVRETRAWVIWGRMRIGNMKYCESNVRDQ
jgi:hypothetical protein